MKKGTNKKALLFLSAVLLTALTVGFVVTNLPATVKESGAAQLDFTLGSVHSRIVIEKDGEVVLDEYHAGSVTKLGLNLTLGKLAGNESAYNGTQYMYNLTHVGIGDQGTLNTDSVVLPGEWNRTVADTQHDQAYNTMNWTLVIHPGAGPYTADCLGVYFHSTNDMLFLYDTFSEVTGIDDSFTITLEIQLSAS